ncbi:MAG: polysaccharide biosynthesis protein [Nocardioidaceae bacterium]|nr:polysaccharide biosynthesis protein [Nocardioidaceae bacterium]
MTLDGVALLFSYLFFTVVRYWGAADTQDATSAIAEHALGIALVAIVLQWSVGSFLRMYQGRATVASLDETFLLASTVVCIGCALSLVNIAFQPYVISRGVPLAATFMALFVMLLGRAVWRLRQHGGVRWSESAVPALVFGAGAGGTQLVASMMRNPASQLRPVGFLDDDPWKRRLRVAGVPVIGSRGELASAARETGAGVLVIAIPSASPELIREVSRDARACGLRVKVIPGVDDLLAERVSIRDVRDIDIHDVLGRNPVETDVSSIAGYLTGKRVLVTGAGGSIGSELCRQINRWGPSELIMLDRDESGLHATELSIMGRALLDSGSLVLADIRDAAALGTVFRERQPQVVFHAAALKHLTMLEQYPAEAMKTNVVGTANVLEAAAAVGVERFVNISTDKAADPSSVLGCSKRVAERLTAAMATRDSGTYLSVRFGNVLGSRGSVLTAFAAQIAAGGPVTVTHPDVTRYFMTVDEAVLLVIQAAAIGNDGEALILDMGEPIRIQDVAEQLIDQSGRPIEIVYTGLREGEKLHEVLLSEDESSARPVHPLVSHVAVPPLDARALRPWRDDGHDSARARMERWAAHDEPALLAVLQQSR